MLAMVNLVGERMAMIMPKIQKRGVIIPTPIAKQVALWVKTQRRLYNRFFRKHPPDKRHTSEEFGHIAELAQWLVAMHNSLQNIDRRKNGMPEEPCPQLTFDESKMILRPKTYG